MADMQMKLLSELEGFRVRGKGYPHKGDWFLDKRNQPQQAQFDYCLDMFEILIPVDQWGNDIVNKPQDTQDPPTIPGNNNGVWSQALAETLRPLYSCVNGAVELAAPNKPEEVGRFQTRLLQVWAGRVLDVVEQCLAVSPLENGVELMQELKETFSIEMCLHPELVPKALQPGGVTHRPSAEEMLRDHVAVPPVPEMPTLPPPIE